VRETFFYEVLYMAQLDVADKAILPYVIAGVVIAAWSGGLFSGGDEHDDEYDDEYDDEHDDEHDDRPSSQDWDDDIWGDYEVKEFIEETVLLWATTGTFFGLSKKSYANRDKKKLEKRLKDFSNNESFTQGFVASLPPSKSSEISRMLEHYSRAFGPDEYFDLCRKVVNFSALTASGADGWTKRKRQSFARVCKRLEVPRLEQERIIDHARISYLERKYNARPIGTAFFVNRDGIAISCEHVADGSSINYVLWEGGIYKANVLYSDEFHDFSVISIDGVSGNPFLSVSPKEPELTQNILIYGFPDMELNGYNINVTKGSVASLTGLRDKRGEFRIDAVIHHGNSGSPVIAEEDGRVIGMASRGPTESHNFAVKSKYMHEGISSECPHVSLESNGLTNQFEKAVLLVFEEKKPEEKPEDEFVGFSREELLEIYPNMDPNQKFAIFDLFRANSWDTEGKMGV
jgi:S1-C subfamily serine protease